MAEWSHDDKTEAPTPRRREEARKQGQVAVSPDLTSALTLGVATLGLWLLGPQFGERLSTPLEEVLGTLSGGEWGVSETLVWGQWFLSQFFALTLVALAGLFVVGLLASALQAGLHVTTEALQLKWERLSPVEGWSRLMSMDGVVRGLMTVLKLVAAVVICGGILWSRSLDLQAGTRASLPQAVQTAWSIALSLLFALAVAALVIAAADYLFRRLRHEQRLRMTRKELKDELRDDQGDPLIRQRQRALQRERATAQSLKDVAMATMIVTNPTHISVALQYRSGQQGAPKVLAKGQGRIALRIRELAREHGVPIYEQKPLARALYALVEVGQEIPVELYHAVAELLARVYRRRQAA